MKNTILLCMRLTAMWFLGACSLLPLSAIAASATAPSQSETQVVLDRIRSEHQRVLDDLNAKNDEGQVMDLDDPRVPALVKKGWDLAGQWAATYIETHPAASKTELGRVFEGFAPKPRGIKSQYGDFLEYKDYSFSGSAVRVGPSVYVIVGSYLGIDFPTGTFMVVAKDSNGHYRALWNIKDLAEKHYPQRDEIGRWVHLTSRAYYNGPLDVSDVLPVAHAANGHTRFMVKAYQGADGGTALAQLSIWEWDGMKATLLLVEVYSFALDDGGFRFDGRTIRISTKEDTKAFWSCGGCVEPRGVWRVRITTTGVRDLGRRFVQPEVQWADELLTKISKTEDTTQLASPMVVGTIKAWISEDQSQSAALTNTKSDDEFSWGEFWSCAVISRGNQGAFVLRLDEGELRFKYVLRRQKPYFVNVRIK